MFRLIKIYNFIVFLSVIVTKRIPFSQWQEAWQFCQAEHEKEVKQLIKILVKEGKVIQVPKDGEFVYFPSNKKLPDWAVPYPPNQRGMENQEGL